MDHQQPLRTPKMAISSLISGILGLICLLPVIGSLLAIVLGHMSHSSIKNSNGQLGGSGVAIAGFVTGYAGVVLLIPVMLIMAGMMLPALDQAREKARRMNCAGNLKQIGLGLIMFAGDDVEHGRFPDNLGQLHEQKYLVNGRVYGCPSTDSPSESAADSDYVYVGAGLKDTNRDPKTTVLAYCDPANHDDQWTNILFLDGDVTGQGAQSIEQAAEQNGWTIGTGQ